MWALGGEIAQALSRAEASEQRSWQHAREAQQRQGELQRTSKALRDMYALLERTNRELEVARREAEEAKEIKARFAANISHELRTPLNLVMGFSHTMYASPEVYGDMVWPPELRVDIHEIYAASRHLLSMIDDILDLSRIEAQRLPLRLEPTDVAALAGRRQPPAQGCCAAGRWLEARRPDDLPEVMVDRTRIRQVLFNLISNAIRFTDAGEIARRPAARRRDRGGGERHRHGHRGRRPGHHLRRVQPGARPDHVGRGGAGLGLAVCAVRATARRPHQRRERGGQGERLPLHRAAAGRRPGALAPRLLPAGRLVTAAAAQHPGQGGRGPGAGRGFGTRCGQGHTGLPHHPDNGPVGAAGSGECEHPRASSW